MSNVITEMDLVYLKRKDQITDALPESVKEDKAKVQDELDFYPEKLRPFMGLTLLGKALCWRYKTSRDDIFDVQIQLQVPGSTEPQEIATFTIKESWIDVLNPEHKHIMQKMKGIVVELPPSLEATAPGDPEEEYHEEEEEEADLGPFEENALIYLKTATDMGISSTDFNNGSFVKSEYYPERLRKLAGGVYNTTICEYYAEHEGVEFKMNRITIHCVDESISVDIPHPDAEASEDPAILLFSYENWLSMFANIIEAHGPRLNDLVEALKYLETLDIKTEVKPEMKTECAEEVKEAVSDPSHVGTLNRGYGEEFLAILKGHKELGITEEEFYSKAFKGSEMYPNTAIGLAGTAVEAVRITEDLATVLIDKKPYDISVEFLVDVEGKSESKHKDPMDIDDLPMFSKDSAKDADKVNFPFVLFPTVSGRAAAARIMDSTAELIKMLRHSFKISRFTLGLVEYGVPSDFIMISDFQLGVFEMTMPIDMLDLIMFYQMYDQIEVYVASTASGATGSNTDDKVTLEDLSITPEDMYLAERTDEFEVADMFSGSAIKRLVLKHNPNATIIEIRKSKR